MMGVSLSILRKLKTTDALAISKRLISIANKSHGLLMEQMLERFSFGEESITAQMYAARYGPKIQLVLRNTYFIAFNIRHSSISAQTPMVLR